MDPKFLIGPIVTLALAIAAGAIGYGLLQGQVTSNADGLDRARNNRQFIIDQFDRDHDQLLRRIERLEEGRVCK